MTECSREKLLFEGHGRREVCAAFDGGKITSDGGGLLLREVEERFGILRSFTASFTDHRSEHSEFSVEELLRQRVMGIALGYEDLNDHEQLRHDPLLALMCGRRDITGQDRAAECSKGVPLAGKSTLNRLELTPVGATKNSRYKKIVASVSTLQDTLVDVFIRMRSKQGVPTELVLDLDATDDPVHGDQLGKFFHGYYKSYCFLPLYTFCGGWPLGAVLRPSNIDGCAGTVKELERIVPRLRAAWPNVRMIVRADGGFCRDNILAWCEKNRVDYIIGLAKNKRLVKAIGGELQQAKVQFEATGEAARVFKDFRYRTKETWSCERRVIGKAEHLRKGANSRFVVTSLSLERVDARMLYEDRYCARGDMENRIKEQQLYLFADRTSTHNMRSNQLRLLFSTMAYLLHHVLREFGLAGTEMQNAQAGTIRSKLLKIGTKIQVSVRRVVISFSESYPYQPLFERVLANLRRHRPQVMQV
nr:IS1380 family transposase [Fuerstiella marisgermanici]